MPSPAPCIGRVTEVRSLSYGEFCCLADPPVLCPAPIASAPPWTSPRGLYQCMLPGVRPHRGRRRPSPVDQPAFAACHLPYAGGGPGCSRISAPDCCLRQKSPGSAPSAPYGISFRRGRVRLVLRPAALLFLASALGSPLTPENSLPGSSGGLPGRGSHPPVGLALGWAHALQEILWRAGVRGSRNTDRPP
jgi:hypothetical protein